MKFSLIKKYKNQIGDSVFSVMGLVLMNAVAQIFVYPALAAALGDADYGDVQYLMAFVNIITVSVGCAANFARMTAPEEERMKDNGNYHLFLLLVCALGVPMVALIRRFGGVTMNTATTVSYYALFVTMALRYYADVSYKLTLRYRRYFMYYACIAAGYCFGVWLFRQTNIWPLAIVPGEAAGILYAYLRDGTLRHRMFRPSPAWRRVWRAIAVLFLSEGISNLIFNADRLMLKILVNSTAVTIYYLATLVGKTMSLVTTPFNGVLIGYLARYNGKLSRRAMHGLLLGSIVAFALFTGVCVVGGLIVLYWLYPQDVEAVRGYLFIGSLAQVVFFTTGIITTVLIRFAKKSYQVIINGVFAVCFFGFGIPATVQFGIMGFACAMLAASLVRWLTAIVLGYRRVHLDSVRSEEDR